MVSSTLIAAPIADTVFSGGKVYTVNPKQAWAEAVAVKDNKIIYVGDQAGLKAHIGDSTKTIDCKGKTVMPGFISAHDHLIASSWTSLGVNLYDAKDKAETLKLIKEYADAHPDEKVIRGIGWVADKMGGPPTAKDLDTVVPDRPAILLDFTIHDAWLNSAALKAANITKDTPDTLPGVTYWVRDKEGNPLGAAIEIQWMQAYIDMGAWDAETMVRKSADELFTIAAQNGTTSLLNPGIVTPNVKDTHGGMERDFEASVGMLAELEKKGELKLRVQAVPFFKNAKADPEKFVKFAAKMQKQYQGDKIRCDFIKVHPDGNWNAQVSPHLEPYTTGKQGAFNIDPVTMKAVTLAANKAGLNTIIHTDGSATGRGAIDAFEAAIKAGYKDTRNAIHHYTWIHPDDHKRTIDLKIPVNATPNFYNDWSNQREDAYRLLGKERTNTQFGLYSDLAHAGNSVSISADVPSTQPSMQAPLFCVEGAVTLMDPTRPDESKPFPETRKPMTLEQAIRAVTIDAAWQISLDDKVGSLEVGKLADIVVLDKNPFDVKPTEIAEIEVAYTMMDGQFTHTPKDKDIEAESRDEFLGTGEYTPKTSSYTRPSKKAQEQALIASFKFLSTFCCAKGYAAPEGKTYKEQLIEELLSTSL
ncbi:amidohydrolase [Rubritalea tangerina]